MIRIAFDIGGVLSKHPDIWRRLIGALVMWPNDFEVHVITDMHPREKSIRVVHENGFEMIPADRIHSADYAGEGEACKAVLCERLGIDVLIDDFIGYVAVPGAKVRLLMMPDCDRPYYHEQWKTNGTEGDFGRRTRRKPPGGGGGA